MGEGNETLLVRFEVEGRQRSIFQEVLVVSDVALSEYLLVRCSKHATTICHSAFHLVWHHLLALYTLFVLGVLVTFTERLLILIGLTREDPFVNEARPVQTVAESALSVYSIEYIAVLI